MKKLKNKATLAGMLWIAGLAIWAYTTETRCVFRHHENNWLTLLGLMSITIGSGWFGYIGRCIEEKPTP